MMQIERAYTKLKTAKQNKQTKNKQTCTSLLTACNRSESQIVLYRCLYNAQRKGWETCTSFIMETISTYHSQIGALGA